MTLSCIVQHDRLTKTTKYINKTSYECKALSGERRCGRERARKKYILDKLELLALLDCIALPIVLALAQLKA